MKIKEVRFKAAIIMPTGEPDTLWRDFDADVDLKTRELVRVVGEYEMRVPLENVLYRRTSLEEVTKPEPRTRPHA